MKPQILLMIAILAALLSGCATSLPTAAQNNNLASVQSMLAKGANVNERNAQGDTPLGLAANNGNWVMTKLLLDKGANPNLASYNNSTPLLYATKNNHAEIASLLIEHGANVNAIGLSTNSPLLWAVQNNNTAIAKLLIEKGADVKIVNNVGDSPLTWAALKGNAEIVKLLIDKGSDINIVTKNGSTPLLLAVFSGKVEVVKLLIDKGANLRVTNKGGDTPLILAAFKGSTDTAQLLLAQGVDINARNQAGKSAEDFARERGDSAILAAIAEVRKGLTKPAQPQPQQLAELDALVASKNIDGLKTFLNKTPAALAAIKDEDLRLQLTGPAELRIVDIAELAKAKKKDTLIIAQIHSSGGPYKKFSLAEMEALQKLGISDEVIAVMITVTTEFNKALKRVPEHQPQATEPAPPPPPVKAYQQIPSAAQQQEAQNPQSNECIQLALAIKACDKGSGFIPLMGGLAAEGCKAAARSKFNCSLPLEMIMR